MAAALLLVVVRGFKDAAKGWVSRMSEDGESVSQGIVGAGAAIAAFADNQDSFTALFDSFRAGDGESFRRLLSARNVLEHCEEVCQWIRSKDCVLLCLELAGPPPEGELPTPLEFAQVVERVTADVDVLARLAASVSERNPDAFRAFIDQLDLARFAHLLCHWACTVSGYLLCELVCSPEPVPRVPLVEALAEVGPVLRALTADPQAFSAAASAAVDNDCDGLRAAISAVGIADECEVICQWFCTWTCMSVCLLLCRVFPFTPIEDPVLEAFQFAASTTRLASQPGLVTRLTTAIGARDAKEFESIVVELKLQQFCIQLCHWVCALRCHVFCHCVCPPLTEAFFTHIGALGYADPTVVASQANGSGLTVADNRAFFNTLRLNGDLSVVDGAPLVEYRFEIAPTSPHGGDAALPDLPLPALPTPVPAAAWVPITAAQIAPTQIGSFVRSIPVAPFFEEIAVIVNNPGGSVPGVNGVFNITPSGGADPGWIQVPPFTPTPPMVPLGTTGWRFTMGAGLPAFINLDTTKAMPSSVVTINEAGVVAGASGNAPLETDGFFGIRMRLRNVGTTGDGTDAGTCDHIAINNSNYNNISHHPYWPGGLWSPTPATDFEIGLCSIGIAELLANPCSDLTSSLTVTFSAAHSNLGEVTVTMEGPGGPYAFDLNLAPGTTPGENLFGTATPELVGSPSAPAWTFANLPPCAYLLKLDIDVLLTTGDADITPEPLEDYIAFCKST